MEIISFGMGLKRCRVVRNTFILLVLGNIATVTCIYGQSLDCTNDFEEFMFCNFEGENCTEYSMTLVNDSWYGEKGCVFKQCDNGQCCCSVQMPYFISGETFNARIWKGSENIESKTISVTDSVKPKIPTITSITKSMGNFKVVWLTNVKSILNKSLTAQVTYHVKGSTKKESVWVNQTADGGKNSYEIQGRLLKPWTTYVVSVRSYTDWSEKLSDSSKEREFTTSMSSNILFLATIITLCVAAVLISGAIFGCYIKLRSKWRDTLEKCPNPKLPDMHPSEQKFLKPVPPVFSSMYVEPLSDDSRLWFKDPPIDSSDGSLQQSSGIGTGSSCLSYANTEPPDIISEVQDAIRKALSNVIPTSPLTTGLLTDFPQDSSLLCAPYNLSDVQDEDMSSGSSAFLNRTYSIIIPGGPAQTMTDISEVQNKMPCETAYHPSEGATVISTYQQAAPCPVITLPSSSIPTDISYQPCNTDSGTYSFQDSSLSSVSSGTNTTPSCDPVSRDEAACEGFENGKIDAKAIVCDENPCYVSVPAESHSVPAVDYNYQPFQNLVEPSVFISDVKGGEKEEHCNHLEDPYIKTPQTVLNSELQRPLLSLISADQSMPIITESGYQCL
ncbi:uncharacterized protein LOC121509929 [Cheilinus undulatus]|uniref:uncharacterized protein LOC121509929 n=1 Tax=Cheilinus undulatus TaxID=241271 RepID=UPI001BD5DB7E|nr:uncharacterized protein LOC121509929 [Cheilinus undulatus]